MTKPEEKFENLCKHVIKTDTKPFTLSGIRFKSNVFKFTYCGKYLTFVSPNKDYFDIDILTEYYQEEPRMKARRSDQKLSPLDFWNSSENTKVNYKMKAEKIKFIN